MNSVINRFFTKNESTSVAEKLDKDPRYALLDFLISLGSKTTQLKQFSARVEEFSFPQNDTVADLNLVQMYLELEWYLLYKDPRYIGTIDKLRALVKAEFPLLAKGPAFTPLYTSGKNRELALTRNYISYTLQLLNNKESSEATATRWLGLLNFKLKHQTELDLVGQINTIRELRESYEQMSSELADTSGNTFAENTLGSCYLNFKGFYGHLKSINCIDDLRPIDSEMGNSAAPKTIIHINGKNSISKSVTVSDVDKNAILENILDGFLVFNSKGNILEYNSTALHMLGVQEAFIKNYSLYEFLPNTLTEALKNDMDRSQLSVPNKVLGQRLESSLEEKRENNREFEMAFSNNYTYGEDTYSLFLRDITDKKDTLKAIEEGKINAERTAKAKSTFLSNMSHEIRTPLNVILGLSEIIKKRDHMDETLLRKNLDGIDFSAKSLLSIVNDILDFSKIEAGKLSIQSIDFNIRKVVTNLSDGFEIKAREKGLNLVTTIDPDIPDIVIGDQYRLNQILTNLIGNAIKFTQDGEIKVGVEKVSESEKGIEINFKVADTGIGIAREKLDRIFDSFYQVENPDSSKANGTGLGLAITKELIQLQNGTLQASSIVEEGSVFEFTLEFKKSKLKSVADAIKPNMRHDKELSGLKVLVAEDNKMNQFYIKQLLNNLNVEVDIAENGKDAVQRFQNASFDYDLILMDMHMPVMNGLDAITEIRKSNKNLIKKVPIVACSADVFPEARKNAIKVGIDFYLTKPLNEDAVKEVLHWLRSDTEFEPGTIADGTTGYTSHSEGQNTGIAINKLKETFDNDEEFIISLLEIFLKETPDDFKSMKQCIEKEYYARGSALAHKLKSSFMNLGMTLHGHHLQQIESGLLKRESLEDAKKHFTAFKNLYTKALIEATILLIELKNK